MKKLLLTAALAVLFLGAVNAQNINPLASLADSIHQRIISFDTHNDSAEYLMNPYDDDYSVAKGQVTFDLMKKGGLDGAFFAIYVDQGPWRDRKHLDSAYNYCKTELLKWKEFVEQSDEAAIAYNPKDCERIKKEGKRIVVLCIENGYPIRSLEDVDEFAKLGVQYITLSHNSANQICDGSRYPKTAAWHGVSPFGFKVIERMQQLGIMVDVSHISAEALRDVVKVTKAPIIASHSACRVFKPSQGRNLTDEEIKMIASTGGVIQVGTGKFFLTDDLPQQKVGVKILANHIEHIRDLVGIDHVGLGTDFDGGGGVVGMDSAGEMKNLTVELLRRGWSEEDLRKFWGGNLLRVWTKCQEIIK